MRIMIALIWRAIVGSFHHHEWETMEQKPMIRYMDDVLEKIHTRVLCRCKTCGKWTKFDLD